MIIDCIILFFAYVVGMLSYYLLMHGYFKIPSTLTVIEYVRFLERELGAFLLPEEINQGLMEEVRLKQKRKRK